MNHQLDHIKQLLAIKPKSSDKKFIESCARNFRFTLLSLHLTQEAEIILEAISRAGGSYSPGHQRDNRLEAAFATKVVGTLQGWIDKTSAETILMISSWRTVVGRFRFKVKM